MLTDGTETINIDLIEVEKKEEILVKMVSVCKNTQATTRGGSYSDEYGADGNTG